MIGKNARGARSLDLSSEAVPFRKAFILLGLRFVSFRFVWLAGLPGRVTKSDLR